MTMQPVLNEDLIRQVIHTIEDHPDQWDQEAYRIDSSCGTTYCMAGWALVITDGEVPDLEEHQIFEQARKLLGLTYDQAYDLFFFDTVVDDGDFRHPTVEEFKDRVTKVTDIHFRQVR